MLSRGDKVAVTGDHYYLIHVPIRGERSNIQPEAHVHAFLGYIRLKSSSVRSSIETEPAKSFFSFSCFSW